MSRKSNTEARSVFGSKPTMEGLPTIKGGTASDVEVATAIGTIGGALQYLLCSTAWYFGNESKSQSSYDFGPAYEGYYGGMYAAKPLKDAGKRTQKSWVIAFAAVARLPWDTRAVAEIVFNHKHGSLSQKAAVLNWLVAKHATAPPKPEDFQAKLPGPKSENDPTIHGRAAGVAKSLKSISEDTDLMDLIEDDEKGSDLFDKAVTAVGKWANYAKAKADEAKKNEPKADKKAAPAKGKVDPAYIAALAVTAPAKGAKLN